jgi:CheY-like chemotaxis protein
MSQLPRLILVDDDPEDRSITRNAFEENILFKAIEAVEDGRSLLQYLESFSVHEEKEELVILLDLHMPRQNGLQVLRELKKNRLYESIPVVIYTGSNNRFEVESCYRSGAAACVLKPNDYRDIIQLGKALKNSWNNRLENLSEYIAVL